jgi:hypothetical protein
VKCDRETTTQADVNLGIVNIEVGFPTCRSSFVYSLRLRAVSETIGNLSALEDALAVPPMKQQRGATFRRDRIVARAKAMQLEMRPNSWPYSLFCALWELEPPSGEGRVEYWQSMRKAIVSALREHESKFRYALDDVPFPAGMASYLATALSDLSEGEGHPLLERRIPPGGRGNTRSRSQQQYVDAGVDYLVGVDIGLIEDERSRTTVAEQFGVTRKQVQRWLAARGTASRRNKEFRERWSQRLARDQSREKTTARMVRKLMLMFGKEYKAAPKKGQ